MPHSLNSETLARIIDGSSIASSVINCNHIIIHWNTAQEVLTGIKRDKIIGTNLQWKPFYQEKRPSLADLIVDGATENEIARYYGQQFRKSTSIEGAYEAEDFFPSIGKNGSWLHFTASPIRNDENILIGAISTCQDVTELKTAEVNLRYYLKEITKAQEEERKHIARELHDDTAQLFGSISRQLDNFIRKNHNLEADEILLLKDIQAQAKQGSQNLHRFCQGLRLSVLDDLGLIPALRSMVKEVQKTEGLEVEIEIIGETRRSQPEIESMLFRIVQEAINNVRKHAQSSVAKVIIKFMKNRINITISDNGKGFLMNGRVDELPQSGKLGLAGIQERVRLLGGTFEIVSAPGKGTTLLIKNVPLKILN
jgi:PAS domain S-box-containing protein